MVKQNIVKNQTFPQKLRIVSKIKTGEIETVNEFDKYFADIGPSLAKDISDLSMLFKVF